MVKTAAIRIAYKCSKSEVIWRPTASASGPGVAADPAAISASSPPAKAAPANGVGDEQQAAAECGCEEPVLQLPNPVSHDADEPQEGDTGEWH